APRGRLRSRDDPRAQPRSDPQRARTSAGRRARRRAKKGDPMKNGTAVVIGGSIAGSCAARVLADHFERVVVLDRDAFPQGPLGRPGVPQGRHVHTLLARGCAELERLFPGFEETMLARGAMRIDFGLEFARLGREGWAPRQPGSVPTL